ncbi:lipopolysaccharide biosynthesis protein [Atopococcus tabaci]|uniref:lipopolysaccharide biosynthesis protein n=1 Tax=Atopococcus tabaci TaxID=269774 RepID=UPI0004247AC5|nr:hypothetical protein [Atopococcus tabaci]
METSRRKATAQNIVVEFSYQLIMISFGFIIPRLFLTHYGPTIHGLTSSITNVMSYVLLLNAGLNTASIQALYDPLNRKDTQRLNEVLNAIRQYYFQTGLMFTAAIVALAFILPIYILDIPRGTVFSLMLVMGLQSTLNSFLVSKNTVLLQADQKLYMATLFNMAALFLRGILQTGLILVNSSVIVVQAVPALMMLVIMVLQNVYVRKHYPGLNTRVKPDKTALSKRWSAFLHQISGLVVNNTDIIILTVATGDMILVSIYSVYQLVFSNLYNLMKAVFSEGSVASFGSLMVTKDEEGIKRNYNLYEFIYFAAVSVIYSVTAVLILPFVSLYTAGTQDVAYADPRIAVLFVVIGVVKNLRVPGTTLIDAGGFYKETQWRAVLEAFINITVSLLLVGRLGLYGLLIGTVASFAYRTLDIIFFSNRHILKQSSGKTMWRAGKVILIVMTTVFFFTTVFPLSISSWMNWILSGIVIGLFSVAATFIFSVLFEQSLMKEMMVSFKQFIKVKFV